MCGAIACQSATMLVLCSNVTVNVKKFTSVSVRLEWSLDQQGRHISIVIIIIIIIMFIVTALAVWIGFCQNGHESNGKYVPFIVTALGVQVSHCQYRQAKWKAWCTVHGYITACFG